MWHRSSLRAASASGSLLLKVQHLSALCFFLTLFVFSLAVMWLWATWRGHLAVCISGQLRHLLPLISRAVGRQHGHRHRRHRHGDRLPRLPGCHQGEQVPASEREFNLKSYATLSYNTDNWPNSCFLTLSYKTPLHSVHLLANSLPCR